MALPLAASPRWVPLTARRRPAGRSLLETGALWLLAVLFVLLTAVRFLTAPLDRFDEGLTVTTAAMTAAGRTIYRDFWSTYGPLDSSLLGMAFRLAGHDILVERAMAIAVACSFAIAAYTLTVVLRLPRPVRLLVTVLLAVVPQSVGFLVASFTADLFALLAVVVFLRSFERPARWLPAAAGALTAVTSFGRPELGVVLGIGLLAGYGIVVTRNRSLASRMVLPYLAGGVLVGGALWIPVLLAAGVAPVVYTFLIYPATLYRVGRGIPIGQGEGGSALLLYSAGCLVVWAWTIWRAWTVRADPAELARLLAVLVPAVLVFSWVWVRADPGHALAAWPFSAAALAVVLGRRQPATRGAGWIAVGAALFLDLFVGGLIVRDATLPGRAASAAVPHASLPGVHAWLEPQTLAAVVFAIDQDVPQGQALFVGLRRNDRAPFNDAMLYFLADRLPATVYYEAVPAFTTSEEIERRMICQLQRAAVSLAVLGPNGDGETSNASSQGGATRLDRWIAEHATSRRDIGPYEFVRLRVAPPDATCAQAERALS